MAIPKYSKLKSIDIKNFITVDVAYKIRINKNLSTQQAHGIIHSKFIQFTMKNSGTTKIFTPSCHKRQSVISEEKMWFRV